MSSANSPQNSPPKGIELKLEQLLKGCQTVLPTGSSITLNGVSVAQPQIVQDIQNVLAPYAEVRAEKTLYLGKVKAKDAAAVAAHEFVASLRSALIGAFGRKNPQLSAFGIAPSNAKVLTTAQKLLAAAKRKITRQKRNTLGSQQKLAVKAVGIPNVTVGATGPQVTPSPLDVRGGSSGVSAASGSATPAADPGSSAAPSVPSPWATSAPAQQQKVPAAAEAGSTVSSAVAPPSVSGK